MENGLREKERGQRRKRSKERGHNVKDTIARCVKVGVGYLHNFLVPKLSDF